ncbi:hypothetical protein HY415_02200 [Candidatus Kaiserbacteria bacterium]|nr:hypothetical protein [Candidatus Kaiserbacteria bacterium]
MDRSYAHVRRLITAVLVVNIGIFPLFYAFLWVLDKSVNWDDAVLIVGIVVNLALMVWLIVDWRITFRLSRNAGLLGPEPSWETLEAAEKGILKFWNLFFVEGVTWKYLKSLIKEREAAVREAERAKREAEDRLKTEQERREAEERKRREERKVRAEDELLQEGVALGIPKEEMQACLAENLDRARALIAEKRREAELVRRAVANTCVRVIQPLLRSGQIDEAETVVARAAAVIETATRLDIEETVRLHVSNGEWTLVEKAIADAERDAKFRRLVRGLDKRISALPLPQQAALRMLLKTLEPEKFGTREFRKTLHDIEGGIGS